MTPQEIIEGNKLIAEFMNININSWNRKWFINTYTSLKYHSSWDWLMEVVQKIWGITNCSDSIFRFTVGYKTYIMLENDTGKHIEVCWNTCLAFIKWYNQNKSV
jgi:3-methyladenine DNA glycosylase Mpg